MKTLTKVTSIIVLVGLVVIQFVPQASALTCPIGSDKVTDENGKEYCQDLSDLGS